MFYFLLASVGTAAIAATPITDAQIARGRVVRTLLLDLMEQSYLRAGVWPDRLPSGVPAGLDYVPLSGPLPAERDYASTTVILNESFADHPDGVWIGYADGHLEFAPDAATLTVCRDQAHIIQNAPLPPEALKVPPTSTGQLVLKVTDPDGHAVPGALVGVFTNFGNSFPKEPRVTFAEGGPAVTDAAGQVSLPPRRVFDAKFYNQPAVPLYILDESRQLVAGLEVHPSDFGPAGTPPRQVRLSPACRVTGEITGVDLPNSGREIRRVIALAFAPGNERMYTQQCMMNSRSFELPLPPGDYGLDVYGTDSGKVYRFIHIAEGQRTLALHLDLPPSTITRLSGHPAPEFQNIKAWKNSRPLTLASLRGHPVVLDFWGHWCNPCCEAMPELMKLYDAYKDRGLVVIAVHDDSVESIQEMDQKLVQTRAKLWAGRDLPFPVALDGGGETRIRFSAARARGATTAAYGITSFPTTLLVSPDGVLLGEFDPSKPKDIAKLDALLKSK